MERIFMIFVLMLALWSQKSYGLTTFHRGNKISENFKKAVLSPEEIDPNVAPSVEELQELQVSDNVGQELVSDTGATNDNEIVEELDDIPPDATVTNQTVTSSTTLAPVETVTPVKNEDDAIPINKFCKCTEAECDCCRNIGLSFLPIRGPACARISYLGNEKMSISLKFGDIVLASRTILGKRAKPICMPLIGGYSQFCGRVYGLSRAKEDFKACLGFELRADEEVEAALRVSCFKFGPKGLRIAEAEPMPSEVHKDEEDDDDGVFGFGSDDNDYDDDDDEEDDDADDDVFDDDDDDDDAGESTNDDDAEYGGFSFLLDEFTESGEAATGSTAQNTRRVEQKSSKKKTVAIEALASDGTDISGSTLTVPVEATAFEESSTPDYKKSSKSKKNKKKKSSDADYAMDLINGLLDFFN